MALLGLMEGLPGCLTNLNQEKALQNLACAFEVAHHKNVLNEALDEPLQTI